MRIQSFPAVACADATVLILGSMPGKASLAAHRYYAHPRNAFWPIIDALFGIPSSEAYEARLHALLAHRLALWDVLQACVRSSSLDADIVEDSIVPNDFLSFFGAHPAIRRVCFNGAKAEQVFRRRVLPVLGEQAKQLQLIGLPSTSPAHAALSREAKVAAWRQALLP